MGYIERMKIGLAQFRVLLAVIVLVAGGAIAGTGLATPVAAKEASRGAVVEAAGSARSFHFTDKEK